jgi:uncharacterized protein (DUF362 family)/Pyruvate/2-oxoacid:ferredoxin oxidoreductase delta subunit
MEQKENKNNRNTKSNVIITRCKDYKKEEVTKKIKDGLDLIGGLEKYIGPAKKILLKPNLLSATKPEKAVTTHPVFIESIIELIKKIRGDRVSITIADSPGVSNPHTVESLKKIYEECGLDYLDKIPGVNLSLDEESIHASFKEGKVFKHLDVIKPVMEADLIINLPKFKTHSLTRITGAVKNMYGIIHGRTKTVLHTKFMELEKFNDMLIDVFLFKKPVLNIMDGITGIEGEGPGASGTFRKTGIILISTDGIAMDHIVAYIMGFDSDNIPLIRRAASRGFASADLNTIVIPGGQLKDYKISDFKLPKNTPVDLISKNRFLKTYILPFIRNTLSSSPYQDIKNCTMCEICIDICPEKAITRNDEKLVFDYKKCIRCYCCSEMCPHGGIDLRYTKIGNFILSKKILK